MSVKMRIVEHWRRLAKTFKENFRNEEKKNSFRKAIVTEAKSFQENKMSVTLEID